MVTGVVTKGEQDPQEEVRGKQVLAFSKGNSSVPCFGDCTPVCCIGGHPSASGTGASRAPACFREHKEAPPPGTPVLRAPPS